MNLIKTLLFIIILTLTFFGCNAEAYQINVTADPCSNAVLTSTGGGDLTLQFTCGQTEKYRFLAVGDGVTSSDKNRDSWRRKFTQLLQGEGVLFDMVGSKTSATALNSDFDAHFEGGFGFRSDDIATNIASWMATYTAQYALLYIGTQDALKGQAAADTITDIGTIVTALRADNPSITIFIAKIAPTALDGANTIITSQNTLLDTYVSENSTEESGIVAVTVSEFSAGDLLDGINPNTFGELKIASAFFNAWRNYTPSPGEPPIDPGVWTFRDNFDWTDDWLPDPLAYNNSMITPYTTWQWRALDEITWDPLSDEANVIKGDGKLTLRIPAGSSTGAHLHALPERTLLYGKFCASIKFPPQTSEPYGGLSSIWMYNNQYSSSPNRRPEIDMAYILDEGRLDLVVYRGTQDRLYTIVNFPHAGSGITDPSDDFNTYCISWYRNRVDFSINGWGPDQDPNMRIDSGEPTGSGNDWAGTPHYPMNLIVWNASFGGPDSWGGDGAPPGQNLDMEVEWVGWQQFTDDDQPPIEEPPPSQGGGALKILPLGDSITATRRTPDVEVVSSGVHLGYGHGYNSYRPTLYALLTAAGYDFDFIGPYTSTGPLHTDSFPTYNALAYDNAGDEDLETFNITIGPGHDPASYDVDHAGQGGIRADEIVANESYRDSLAEILAEIGESPDVVLLHIGTNDLAQDIDPNNTPAETVEDVEDIISQLRADNPNVIIFVAQIMPIGGGGDGWGVSIYNSLLANMALNLTSEASPIYVVDMHTDFVRLPSIFWDSWRGGHFHLDFTHPNKAGEDFMAQQWFDAIQENIPLPSSTLLNECQQMASHPEWIFCDDFDDPVNDTLQRNASQGGQRWHYHSTGAGADTVLLENQGIGDSKAFRMRWSQGEVDAGQLMLVFGRHNVNLYPDHVAHRPTEDFREIYYRFYMRNASNFEGYPAKLARLRINYAPAGWAVDGRPMFEHLINADTYTVDGYQDDVMLISYPNVVSGGNTPVDPNWNPHQVMCATANARPYANLSSVINGGITGCGVSTNGTGYNVYDTRNTWECIEVQVKLNDPVATPNTQGNGLTRMWINDELYHEILNQNLSENYTAYGLNHFFLQSWWNAGSVNAQDNDRFFDNVIISTERIGCGTLP